ncbi:MAG TPA: hypothetical protein VLB44_07340 [Kofleriaceae bacterium]|nr:hypothetical protein [Kofleriaceae bacterium]
MRRALLLVLPLAACQPDFDFDLDLSFGDHTVGQLGAVTFSLVDGCPDDGFFGCPNALPVFAIGARPRFVIGSIDGRVEHERRIAAATARSTVSSVAAAEIDDTGMLVVQGLAEGHTAIEILDGNDVIDRIALEVAPIHTLEAGKESTTVLVATPIGARITARDPAGRLLYARGAVTASTSGTLVLDADNQGFFAASDQVAVFGELPGEATVSFSANAAHVDVPYRVVETSSISKITLAELPLDATVGNKTRLYAQAFVGDERVRGGATCEWSIVSGGGPDAALAAGTHDDRRWALFQLFDQAILYGSGDVVVQCRANPDVAGQATVHLLQQ